MYNIKNIIINTWIWNILGFIVWDDVLTTWIYKKINDFT